MSSPPPRRPSTLAARKFEAAQRGLGSVPDSRASARGEQGPMMGVGRTSLANASAVPSRLVTSLPLRTRPPVPTAPVFAQPVRSAAKPVAERAPESPAAPRRAETQRRVANAAREQTLVTSLIVVFVFVAMAIAAVQVRGNMKVDKSRQALGATFTKVFEQQGTYRLLNGRFATWRELEQRGARLAPSQKVVGSNASASHWFLSVRDTGTGVTCSRTGELFDESPTERTPTCVGGEP